MTNISSKGSLPEAKFHPLRADGGARIQGSGVQLIPLQSSEHINDSSEFKVLSSEYGILKCGLQKGIPGGQKADALTVEYRG